MTKPKLDACEQRWVSKLAPYNFKIKYVPGRLNVVADALSRDPFVKPVSQCLLSDPCSELLKQVHSMEDDLVEKTFRLTCQSQTLDTGIIQSSERNVSMTAQDVSSVSLVPVCLPPPPPPLERTKGPRHPRRNTQCSSHPILIIFPLPPLLLT